jgi:hypothetical protein
VQLARRAILKSLLAGSALAAYGLPRFSVAAAAAGQAIEATAAREILLLTSGMDGTARSFGLGVQANGAVHSIALGSGLPDAAALRRLLAKAHGKRLVGLMSDASYVLFSELARDAGLARMYEGHHRIAMDGASARHSLLPVPGFHGTAPTLAAALVHGSAGFSITETTLGGGMGRGANWSALGFSSYRIGAASPQPALWLHLSGLTIGQGCGALGMDPGQAEASRCRPDTAPADSVDHRAWEQALGQALAALAAGNIGNSAPCIDQAFIRRPLATVGGVAHDSFVSFVMQA